MEANEAIKPIRDVVREHIEATMARYFPGVPQYRIAMELGISPTTLIRLRKRWNGSDESLVKDRR